MESKCEYCEEMMPSSKMYMTILERDPDDYHKNVYAYGHKRCVSALKWAYDRTGRIVTLKEQEVERFDPCI